MIFKLPLPPRACHPNARSHWRVRALQTKEYRYVAGILAWDQKGPDPPLQKATIHAELEFKQKRIRDPDNLLAWLKPAFDGLVDAKVLARDDQITHLPTTWHVGRDPGVVLTIEKTGGN